MKNIVAPLMTFIACTTIIVPVCAQTFWTTQFEITPNQLLTGEDRTVTASVRMTHPDTMRCRSCLTAEETQALRQYLDKVPEQISLIQYEDDGTTVKYRWQLNDRQQHGDKVAGDHIFTAQFQLKKRKAQNLAFHLEAPGMRFVSLDDDTPAKTSVSITPRPTFLDLLHKVWLRITEST